jgi:hypothetical protein
VTAPKPAPVRATRRVAPKPVYEGPFSALDTLWDDEDAGPWGCPIGVELALKHREKEETP